MNEGSVLQEITKNNFDNLYREHGPLMRIDGVAAIFHKSTDALRIIMSRDSDFSTALNAAKKRYGRSIYFRTEKIADMVDNGIQDGQENV